MVNALQRHTQDVQLQSSILPWVSPVSGVSSSHLACALAHKDEKTKQALEKQIYGSKALELQTDKQMSKAMWSWGASHQDHVSQLHLIHPDGHHDLRPA